MPDDFATLTGNIKAAFIDASAITNPQDKDDALQAIADGIALAIKGYITGRSVEVTTSGGTGTGTILGIP